ncbi:MAG: hypothetical protein LBL83_01600 [Clostridiales bacterium]|jgi:FSR family fosmidomycin resistance protein-like MFS transporter|nr:hypothetical protein [Clostridiales bacterium]
MVSVYAAAHFLVDFACAFLMFRGVAGAAGVAGAMGAEGIAGAAGAPGWQLCLLLYNFCAFAMQMPLGVLADRLDRNHLFAAGGCALVGAAFGLWRVPAAAAAVAGIGNGMFHVGGGIDVLNASEEKSGALGIFVSPGALGVYFGTALGRGSGSGLATAPMPFALAAAPITLALLAAIGLIFAARRAQGGAYAGNAAFSLGGGASPRMLAAAAGLFFVVCLRSYAGLALSFPWKSAGGAGGDWGWGSDWGWGVALACAAALGKAAGGLMADRAGLARASCASLGLAALLALAPRLPAAGALSALLFNMTMPVTLWATAKIFPGAKGFSFGLLAFGLFLGFLPAHLGAGDPFGGGAWPFALAAAASLALLLASLRMAGMQNAAPQKASPQEAAPLKAGPQEVAPQEAGPRNAGMQNAGPRKERP